MIENEYPIPSYIADVFEKPDGWVETPEPIKPSLLDPPTKENNLPKQKVYAIDCEMVCRVMYSISHSDALPAVPNGGWQRAYASLHD
jgi:hypothetical protein